MRALSAFNRQSGIQVTQASGSSTPSVMAKAVRGNMTPQQALAQLLAGTGIDFQFTSNRAVVIGSRQTSSGSPAADGTTVLETIIVSGKTNRRSAGGSGYQGTPDSVYEEPASVSVVSREAIQNNPAMRNAGDALDTVAGVLTNRSESQKPGLSVNVRGLQDMNRVTTSIDGARQNFQRSGHGSYQQVFVDTSFIRSVEVEKGGVTGVGGAGALGGMVNFRTIEADDIIQSGKNWGAELKTGSGTNAYNFDGSFLGGVRLSDDFSILGGISSKRIGDYKIGSRGQVQLLGVEGNTVVDDRMLYSRNEALNTLLKTEWQVTDDLKIENSWLRYEADGAQGGNLNGAPRRDDEHYVNNTLTTAISYDPDTDLIDTKSRFWYNDTTNEETRGYIGGGEPVSYGMKSFGGSLENTSRFTLPVGELSLHYGVEAFHDNGQTKTADLDNPSGPDSHFGFAGTNPSGKRTMASGFANATLQHEDWLTLTGGLRYDHYKLYGSTLVQNQRIVVTPAQNCLEWQDVDGDGTPDPNGVWFGNDGNIYHSPGPDREFATPSCELWETPASSGTVYDRFPVDVDQSGGAWLPSATIAVKPFEWLQPFISYSKTYRPPAITEALISGGHPFVPFENMPNPSLKPERGETWEFGVNIAQDAILTDEDTFRLKAVYFNRNIEDYISMGQLWFDPAQRTYVTYLNLDGTTRMRGLELEANYDLGHVYLGASYTHIDTDFATSYDAGINGGGTQDAKPAVIFVTPKDRFTLDVGMRVFDRRLVVGGRLTYVSNAAPDIGLLSGNYNNDSYTVYDLYGSWAFNDQAKLRFGVSNLTDEKYVPGLGTNSYPAPGRTITASLNMKF
ncbi:TonB-dependent hemoglobin/transferrin/lactoferrin family receptor [Agrobacterium rosae]|nr:TonB-dependent receptor [Agrobacterium rosae]MBN7809278.1 TonB-dependent hemoglobin/transferrin/lactoferrin family receptor [Agrobacterium rosae]